MCAETEQAVEGGTDWCHLSLSTCAVAFVFVCSTNSWPGRVCLGPTVPAAHLMCQVKTPLTPGSEDCAGDEEI